MGKKVIKILFSMGASLAIMYTAKYPSQISSLILDTPFRLLKKVVLNVA
jgi:pimeloyl-ACP methyl ester carboxylesterase